MYIYFIIFVFNNFYQFIILNISCISWTNISLIHDNFFKIKQIFIKYVHINKETLICLIFLLHKLSLIFVSWRNRICIIYVQHNATQFAIDQFINDQIVCFIKFFFSNLIYKFHWIYLIHLLFLYLIIIKYLLY